MSLMDEPKLLQELNIPTTATSAAVTNDNSPTKMNAKANAFVPSGETKNDKE